VFELTLNSDEEISLITAEGKVAELQGASEAARTSEPQASGSKTHSPESTVSVLQHESPQHGQ